MLLRPFFRLDWMQRMAAMSLVEWNLTIGEIVAPFGLAGEVKVRLETDFPERFARLKQVCLRWPTGRATVLDVESTRLHKGQVLLKLRGITTIDAAETLRNALVQVREQEAVPLPANEFYIHDLIGCAVVTVEGRTLGQVTSVLRGGAANDVLVIGEGKSEILLPMVRDVIRQVDIALRRILVSPSPGLLPGEAEES
jgi:16S rRNA processing protein RimM